MKKTGNIKKILVFISIIMIAIFVKASSSQAVYFSSYSALKSSKKYYCIEHQDSFTGGTWKKLSTTTYYSDSAQPKRALAYILYQGYKSGNGGYNNKSKYQVAVWKYYYARGINTKYPSGLSDGGLYNKAKSVSSVAYSGDSAGISLSNSKITMTGEKASVKVTSLTGTVSTVTVTFKNNSTGETVTKEISNSSGESGWIQFYSDKSCTNSLNVKNISKGTFYMKNLNTDYRITNIKIKVNVAASGYKVTVTRWRKSTNSSSQQDLISATITEGKSSTKTKSFNVTYSYGKIQLIKEGYYYQDGEKQTENVSATFKIYCNTLGKWVSGDANGYKTYVDSIDDATEYSSGTTISYLFASYNYRIFEMSVDGEYYSDIKMVSATKTSNGTTTSLGVAKDSTTGKYRTANIKIENSTTIKVTIEDTRTAGDLTIYKVDKNDTSKYIDGVKIKIYYKDADGNTGWLVQNSDGSYSYNGSITEATEFETSNGGKLTLTCVKVGYYYIYETGTPEGYDLEDQEGYMNANGKDPYTFSEDNEWAYLGTKTLHSGSKSKYNNSITATYKQIGQAKLQLEKEDDTYETLKLAGAEFKIYAVLNNGTSGWMSGDATSAKSYVSSADDATTYTTNDSGLTDVIEKLNLGIYYIYETGTPEGYDITKQEGYMDESGEGASSISGDWAYMGSVNIAETGTYSYTLTNIKKVNELEGLVWIDKPDTKANDSNSLYKSGDDDQNDEELGGITVNLYLAGSESPAATTTTEDDGTYTFNFDPDSENYCDVEVTYWDLATAYVEFVYDNTSYVVVDPFVGTDISINSKAQEYLMEEAELEDENLTGTTGEYPGLAVTYQGGSVEDLTALLNNTEAVGAGTADLTTTPLTGYYEKEDGTTHYKVSNINLGMMEKVEPTFSVYETLSYVYVTMNGYTYQYNFDGTDSNTYDSAYLPSVSRQNTSHTFGVSVYPSDIAYNKETNTDTMKVYVVYRIDVYNSETLTSEDLYYEQKLYLSSLTNIYDSDRYSLYNEVIDSNCDEQVANDIVLWSDDGESQVKYDLTSANSTYYNGINAGDTVSSYVQFIIKNDALTDILSGNLTSEGIKDSPAVATAYGYHEYQRTDNLWNHTDSTQDYNGWHGIHTESEATDSTPYYPSSNSAGDKYYTHKSIITNDSSGDLYINLKLSDARTISGTVYEDEEVGDTEVGNGIMDEDNRGEFVTVELLDAETYEVATLYPVADNGTIEYETDGTLPKATTETSTTNGTYEFEGVVPGYYLIKFTYGDGSQKIVDTEGNEVDLTSTDYKSTIINTDEAEDTIKSALELSLSYNEETETYSYVSTWEDYKEALLAYYKGESTNIEASTLLEWYKYLSDTTYNTATDDLTPNSTREIMSSYIYTSEGVYDGVATDESANGTLIATYDENGNLVSKKDDEGNNLFQLNVKAYTPVLSISIENDSTDSTKATDDGDLHVASYSGFNFGVIKQVETNVTIDKQITKVELTTQTGSTLVSANPAQSNSSYLTALDNYGTGSKYAKLEIDPDIIYGSGLEVTYTLTLTNNTTKTYDTYEYTVYGEEGGNLATVTVNEIVDMLDEKYDVDTILGTEIEQLLTDVDGSTIKSSSETNDEDDITVTETSEYIVTDDGTETTTTNVYFTGFYEMESGQSDVLSYTVTSLVSANDDDTAYTNDAELTSITLSGYKTLSSLYTWDQEDTTTLTISPTTGGDRRAIYWVAGVIALLVVAGGVILIKKKILK